MATRTERHRASAMLLAAALTLAACSPAASGAGAGSASTTPDDPAATSPPAAEASVPAATASTAPTPAATTEPAAARVTCAPIERPPLQNGSHLLGDQAPPVPYSSQPPTSGWHSSGHFDIGVSDQDDPLSEPDQVSVLEAEGVVVAYNDLSDEDLAVLTRRVGGRYRGRVALTPYGPLDQGAVAFTAWGVLRRCDGVDVEALDRFVRRFGTDTPIRPGH